MIELAKHIEVLLLENDCVIVPGLGGFIAHNRTAIYKDDTNEFYPPMRTIGFNPQLTINDGLLAQSYMQAYNTDFPDATRKIEKVVTLLKEQLYQEGRVDLKDIGVLYYNIKGKYEFEPSANAFFTPSLYGLERFSLPLLPARQKAYPIAPAAQASKSVSLRGWIRNAVAVAAAILLFFILSIPVENTYIDEASYASLGSTDMFEAIRNQSAATTVPQDKEKKTPKKVRNNINTLKPVAVKTEKVVVPEVEETGKPATKKTDAPLARTKKTVNANTVGKSYIIIASLTTSADADKQIKKYKENGYKDVQILECDGRYRIALHAASSRNEAYQEVNELRKNDLFKNAWVFTAK